MEINQQARPIGWLVERRDRINLNPTWQRGPAWTTSRQVLLIDSILRAMDIPKVYLRVMPAGSVYAYDAVDGQQRLRALWMFRDGTLRLAHAEPLRPIDGAAIAGMSYAQLPQQLRDRFDAFQVIVAELVSANNDEITDLFGRLQLGVSLNPAELRNAMLVPMRHYAVAFEDHEFFQQSRISGKRYKRQDFVTHALAMAAYQGQRDIKAADLKAMLLEYGHERAEEVLGFTQAVGDALNVLAEVNRLVRFRIVQKWIFVDLCWLIMQRQAAGQEVDPIKTAARYEAFEERRREYTGRAGDLLKGKGGRDPKNKHLYNYIAAFKAQGGERANLVTRNAALRSYFPNIDRRV